MAENVSNPTDQATQQQAQPQEVATTQQQSTQPERAKITGRGKVEAFSLDTPAVVAPEKKPEPVVGQAGTPADNSKTAGIVNPTGPSAQDGPTLSDDQLIALLKDRGVTVSSFDDLKNNFPQQQQQPQNTQTETPEQKAEKDKILEKRMLDRFLQNGWSVEDYVTAKAVADMDLQQLSENDLRQELRSKKFSEDQINEIIRDSYFQLSDEDIDSLDDTDKEIARLKKDFGAEKLKNYSASRQQQAKQLMAMLRKQIEDQDSLAKQEEEYSAKVAGYLKTYPREKEFSLEKINGQDVPPVKYNLEDSEILEATDVLRDAAKREKFFFTEEGNLNHENVSNLLIENNALKKALSVAYQQGGSKQTEIFQSVFPNSDPLSIGTGMAPAAKTNNGTQGKIVAKGNVEVANTSQRRKLNGTRN